MKYTSSHVSYSLKEAELGNSTLVIVLFFWLNLALANLTSTENYPGQFDPSNVKECETYSLTETTFLNQFFGVVNETTVEGEWQLRPEAAYNIFHFGDFPKVFRNYKKSRSAWARFTFKYKFWKILVISRSWVCSWIQQFRLPVRLFWHTLWRMDQLWIRWE